MEYVLWFLMIFGASYVSSQSEIGSPFRNLFKKPNKFRYLVNCIVCSSAWWSILATFIFSPSAIFMIPIILQFLVNVFIAIGMTYIVYKIIPKDMFE